MRIRLNLTALAGEAVICCNLATLLERAERGDSGRPSWFEDEWVLDMNRIGHWVQVSNIEYRRDLIASFSEACFNSNTVEQLTGALILPKESNDADGDCKQWHITHAEWR